ncbi:MAG TPA: SCO family protein [Vicinamibacteria bacterium]
MRRHLTRLTLLAALAGGASAQTERPTALREVGFDQRLGQALPLDLALRDEAGRAVRLGDYFGKRPVVLSLVYYECPMLCTLTLNGLVSALGVLPWNPGEEFELITVSFDPRETPAQAAAKKKAYLARYQRPQAQAGWHFLTGDAAALRALTGAVGFRYAWDDASKQFAHPAGVVVATPDGRLARYLFGIEYAPKDLRLALLEASSGQVGSPVDQLLLFCYRYDPATGRYGAALMRVMRTAAVLTLLALGGFMLASLRRERAQAARPGSAR